MGAAAVAVTDEVEHGGWGTPPRPVSENGHPTPALFMESGRLFRAGAARLAPRILASVVAFGSVGIWGCLQVVVGFGDPRRPLLVTVR